MKNNGFIGVGFLHNKAIRANRFFRNGEIKLKQHDIQNNPMPVYATSY